MRVARWAASPEECSKQADGQESARYLGRDPLPEGAMRYLIATATALALVACEKRTDRDAISTADSAGTTDTVMARDTASVAPQAATAVADRLLGSWTAKGYDDGSSRAQPFTITWSRSPDGSLAGMVAFAGGEKYNVKMVSTGDSTFVYESDPHQSPTLKAQVVTRTQAKLVGDTLDRQLPGQGEERKGAEGQLQGHARILTCSLDCDPRHVSYRLLRGSAPRGPILSSRFLFALPCLRTVFLSRSAPSGDCHLGLESVWPGPALPRARPQSGPPRTPS